VDRRRQGKIGKGVVIDVCYFKERQESAKFLLFLDFQVDDV
jgi:hypothetical protein